MEDHKKHAHHKKYETDSRNEPVFVAKTIGEDGAVIVEEPRSAKQESHKEEKAFASLDPETEKRIETRLAEIYENDDGSMPDMKRFERKHRRRWIRAVMTLTLSCAFLFGVVFAGMTIFQPAGSFAEEDVIVSVSGEEKVVAGDRVTYRIRYKNAQRIPLAQVTLHVRYPKGFVFEESSTPATNDTHTEWALGFLKEENGGFLDITGRLYGDIGEEQSFRVFLNYTPSNFSSEFQKVGTHTITMAEAPITMTLDTPGEIVPGADGDFVVRLKQAGDSLPLFEGLRLVFDGGASFVKRESKPETDQFKSLEWVLKNGVPKDETAFIMKGSFGGGAGEGGNISASLIGTIPGRATEEYTILRVEKTVKFLATDISFRLSVNGSQEHGVITPGNHIHAIVTLQNTTGIPLTHVRIRLLLDAPAYQNQSILRWSALENQDEANLVGEQMNEAIRRGILTWSRAEKEALSKIEPGQSVTVEADIPIKSSEDTDLANFPGALIRAVAEVQYTKNNKQEHLIANTIDLALNSDTTLQVKDQKGVNAEGKEVHAITWAIKNTFHELKNITVTADLYGDVSWNQESVSAPAGSVSFDPDKRRIAWQIDSMPTALDILALQFPITLNKKNPTQTQLTSKPVLTATDAVTGKEVLVVGEEVEL